MRFEDLVPANELVKYFEVRDGVLFWRAREGDTKSVRFFNSRFAGKRCGRKDTYGYLQTGFKIGSKSYRIFNHRIIKAMKDGAWPAGLIDHNDRNQANNCDENLRVCSQKENGSNTNIYCNNTTGFKGVHFSKRKGKFVAQLRKQKVTILYSLHDNPIEAARAYDAAANRVFGEFSCTNAKLGLL